MQRLVVLETHARLKIELLTLLADVTDLSRQRAGFLSVDG